ncbi:MAG: helix-turn-helix transcriptional regulator [Candidatus Electrothrix sp. Rat3]|nr:helix-turn-helix transcriptional regulator [Candidatus Electrothrix rattekaaiensis]
MSDEYKSFSDLWERIEDDQEYLIEKNILEFTLQLQQLMEKRGISKTELADNYGSSKAYITKVMRGNANFTIETMTKLVNAVQGKLTIHVTGKEEKKQKWFRAIEGKKKPIPRWNKQVESSVLPFENNQARAVAI